MISMQLSQYPYLLVYLFRRLFNKQGTFFCNGFEYRYFEHPYNRTWMNERAVEIPIVWEWVQKYSPDDILEIGNVFPHYFRTHHMVVDKYEKGDRIIQQDVVSLNLPKRFALIVTISTLEHVGWDETPREIGKHLWAISNLKRHLAPGGTLIVTLPLGYNSALDNDLLIGQIAFDETLYFKRFSIYTWEQASVVDVKSSTYGDLFPTSNGLVIGFIHKEGDLV
jgi:hypothetical protein